MHKEEIEGLEESPSSEVLQAVDQDQEMFDYSDTFVDSLDSGTPEENESNELHIHAGDVDLTRTITEQIIDVTLDALQLQLELNCQTLDLIISWTGERNYS